MATLTAEELVTMAKTAGSAGEIWSAWMNSDQVQDFTFGPAFEALPLGERDALIAKVEGAFNAGVRKHRLANGWVLRWTTAPVDYDTFGTETVAEGGPAYFGKAVRQVMVDGEFLNHQEMRYGSGCHGSWERDPRELEAERKVQLDAELAERRAWEAKQAAGLEWLKTLTVDQLEALVDDAGEFAAGDALPARALQYADARAALRAKQEAADLVTRAAEWERCRAVLPDGTILVDDGEERTDRLGRIHRPPHVYYAIRVYSLIDSDALDANRWYVTSTSGDPPGETLSEVARRIEKGQLRIAAVGEVPPHAVLERMGHAYLKDIRRYELDGQVVWVGPGPAFSGGPMVLDERGRIVRKRKTSSEAVQRFQAEDQR